MSETPGTSNGASCHSHDEKARRTAKEDPLDNPEEAQHFEKIVNAFRYYKTHSVQKVQSDYLAYSRLSEPHRKALHPTFPEHLTKMKKCALHNSKMLLKMIENVGHIFENSDHETDVQRTQLRPASESDMEKLQSTLRMFARDWAEEGAPEREKCYGPVLKAVKERIAEEDRPNRRILVPGAGMGRLTLEFARLGFHSQGNEFSLFMLFASNFALNWCKQVEECVIYPWIHQSSNNLTYAEQLRPLRFPDINPSQLPHDKGEFSMTAGDFLDVYHGDTERWDCVASVFFLDTARNPLEYIELIYDILKPGGYWVNLGPLLYHFADMLEHDSIELPWEEIKRIIINTGFVFEEEKQGVRTTYTQNPQSLLKYEYDCIFFVCRKPEA